MSVRYLLDTNICIYIAKHNPPTVRENFARHAANELAMSVITLGELRFGAEKSQSRERAMATIQKLAAHARAEGWILVTNNTREFARVPGLQLENWAEKASGAPSGG
jgi:tRNA(fMet)-specific endonuclease VapC